MATRRLPRLTTGQLGGSGVAAQMRRKSSCGKGDHAAAITIRAVRMMSFESHRMSKDYVLLDFLFDHDVYRYERPLDFQRVFTDENLQTGVDRHSLYDGVQWPHRRNERPHE